MAHLLLRLFSYEKKALVVIYREMKKVRLAQFLSLIILSTNIFFFILQRLDNRKVLALLGLFFALTLKLSPIEFHQIFSIPLCFSDSIVFFLVLYALAIKALQGI